MVELEGKPLGASLDPGTNRVSGIKPDSVASGQLRFGDRIVAINGDGCGGDWAVLHRKFAEVSESRGRVTFRVHPKLFADAYWPDPEEYRLILQERREYADPAASPIEPAAAECLR